MKKPRGIQQSPIYSKILKFQSRSKFQIPTVLGSWKVRIKIEFWWEDVVQDVRTYFVNNMGYVNIPELKPI